MAGTAGAMVSTVPDMTRYAAQLATGAGLSPETAAARQAFTPLTSTGIRLQYGLGVTQLGDWVGHDGSIFGYSNMVWYLPREGATVVVAGNVADAMSVPSQALWGEVVKILYPDTSRPGPDPSRRPPPPPAASRPSPRSRPAGPAARAPCPPPAR